MMRRFAAIFAVALAAYLMPSPNAHAGYSTLAMQDNGITLADGSATGDIFTASSFTVGDLQLKVGTNGFAGFVTETFGAVTFSPGTGTSLSFGDTAGSAVFGSFASSTITESTTPTSVTFYVLGTYTGLGTYAGLTGPASLSITFTQNTSGASIGTGGSLSVPPYVPEPAGLVMGFTSIAVFGGLYVFRRRRGAAA